MVDTTLIGQLIDSMQVATQKLNQAVSENNITEANNLRTFIFDLHTQINKSLESTDV